VEAPAQQGLRKDVLGVLRLVTNVQDMDTITPDREEDLAGFVEFVPDSLSEEPVLVCQATLVG
jgi:hypothetical protein